MSAVFCADLNVKKTPIKLFWPIVIEIKAIGNKVVLTPGCKANAQFPHHVIAPKSNNPLTVWPS